MDFLQDVSVYVLRNLAKTGEFTIEQDRAYVGTRVVETFPNLVWYFLFEFTNMNKEFCSFNWTSDLALTVYPKLLEQ